MEQFPVFENKEKKKSPEEKHSEWMREARILLNTAATTIVLPVGTALVLKELGINVTSGVFSGISAVLYTGLRSLYNNSNE